MQLSILIIAAAFLTNATEVKESESLNISFFDDLALVHGFRLSAVESSLSPVEVASVLVADPKEKPKWRLDQWGTRFSLEDVQEQVMGDGIRLLENKGKRVKILPGGLAGQGIYLEVNGDAEYGGKLRQYGEAWPHLLIEQTLQKHPFHKFESLNFSVEFYVEKCVAATDKPLDNGLHTAHISAFMTVHNINPNSKGFNDMIWFGLPLYDVRYPIPRGHQALDVGKADATGKFICTIAGERFFDQPVNIGVWHTLSCDLLPLIHEALAASQAKGFLTDTVYEDLVATSFNLGWEVPGPYYCAITLRNLDLVGNRINKHQSD